MSWFDNRQVYLEKVQWLNDRNDEYNRNHPTVSDKEWDDVYFDVQSYEFIHPDEIVSFSPTQTIYFKEEVSGLKKVKHNHPMLSLDKTKDINRLRSFIGDKRYIVMGKMDGLTCSLHYENGRLVSAETRGNDGMIGEDVTHNAMVISSIPKKINFDKPLTVDGEVVCRYSDFEYFKSKYNYRNSRNFAAGSLKLLDSKECEKRSLFFVGWDIIEDYPELDQLNKKLKFLYDLNIHTTPYISAVDNSNLEKQIEIVKKACQRFDVPIDGIVVKYDNVDEYRAAGRVDKYFKGGLAYKFYDEEYETTLKDIEWSMGRTGVLTPVAIFNPIEIDGTIVERANLHNISIMADILGQPYYCQPIKVAKMNMIIPQIVEAEKQPLKGKTYRIFVIPKECPCCHGNAEIEISKDGVHNLICTNPQCEGKLVNVLDHFCGKKGLDIKGLSIKTLEKLIDWEWVNDITDIPKLKDHRDEWINKAGFGVASVDKILKAIDDRLAEAPLSAFISGLGIPLVGSRVSKQICERVETWKEFRDLIRENFDFTEWAGFGYEMNKALHEYDYSKADAIVDFITFKVDEHLDKTVQLEAQNFVITGKLQNFKNRQELVDLIEAAGGKVQSSISAKTNYLINNDINSTSAKNKKAKELNIPIITEEEVMEMLK